MPPWPSAASGFKSRVRHLNVIELDDKTAPRRPPAQVPMSRFVDLATRSRSALPNLFDLIAFALIFGAFVAIVHGSQGMTLPLQAPQATAISLDYATCPIMPCARRCACSRRWPPRWSSPSPMRRSAAKSRRAETLSDPAARCSAVGADPRLSVVYRHLFPRPVSRLDAGRRMRGDLRDLHQPGLEHGLLLLSVAAHACRAI